MKFPLKVIFFIFSLHIFSQSQLDYSKVEEYIIKNQLDSAKFYLDKFHNNNDVEFLKKFTSKNQLTYKDYYQFISIISNKFNISNLEILKFVNREVKEPLYPKKIDVDFFNIKWMLISQLEEDMHLEKANIEQKKLEQYVNQFSEKDPNYLWAKTKLQTHTIVMYFIERNIEGGKELSLKNLKIAEELKDKELQIAILFNYAYYLGYEKKITEFIECLEKCFQLEKELQKHTHFYYPIIRNLLNALIYEGNNDDKIFTLLNELDNSNAASFSYILYAQLVGKIDQNSKTLNTILKKFKVNNVLELTQKLEELGKDLNSTSFFYLIDKSAIALQHHKYYDEALAYKQKAIELSQKIYSEELSESIANFKVEQAVQLKEQEIKNEKEKTRLYLVIASLCFFLLIISFFAIRKLRTQSNELAYKNSIIKKSLNDKELLIKEMHHRVKNNFQLITSLIDLQSDDIQDEKYLNLIEKGKSRIKSMSLIHQKLYGNESGLIKFDEFVKLLIDELTFLYKYEDNLEVNIQVKEIYFDVDTAIPLALILNELITNSLKYAFQHQTNNIIYISLNETNQEKYLLIVKDNGMGLQPDFKINESLGSGLKLVERLVKQLHGNMKVNSSNGTKFEILFKDTQKRKEVS